MAITRRVMKVTPQQVFDVIVITAEPVGGGTRVSIDEAPLRGPAKRLHNPLADLLIKVRNVETLRRLESLARRR